MQSGQEHTPHKKGSQRLQICLVGKDDNQGFPRGQTIQVRTASTSSYHVRRMFHWDTGCKSFLRLQGQIVQRYTRCNSRSGAQQHMYQQSMPSIDCCRSQMQHDQQHMHYNDHFLLQR
mmetsp:Transcript_122340/g.391376  ORF Transcript_122340/g.391376 Transcript_122340/m.391376 type:complete len:118 (-) Transcript_122340:3926-4279(-)